MHASPIDYAEEVRAWASMLRSSKTSTLKFAVARAILDEVRAAATAQGEVCVSRDRLSHRLVSYYWYQVRLFRLKQAAAEIQEPNVVRKLRGLDGASDSKWHPSRPHIQDIVKFVVEDGFREVIPRFHSGIEGTIFEAKAGGAIAISGRARAFAAAFEPLLMRSVMAGWAEQVERNNMTPRVLAKVTFDGRRRTSVSKWAKPLRELDDACFYCRKAKPENVQVDHVVPWSFLFDDPAWNLVLACDGCNNSKRDSVPASRFLTALCERNRGLTVQGPASDFAGRVYFSLTQLPHGGADDLKQSLDMLCEQAYLQGFPADWSPPQRATVGFAHGENPA